MVHKVSTGGLHPPTRVLYLRNLPEHVDQEEVVKMCSRFGRITNVLLRLEKRHGFVEFGSREEAVACLDFHAIHPLRLAGQEVALAYSGRSEIILKSSLQQPPHHQQYACEEATVGGGQASRILLLTVTQVVYPVTVGVVLELFGQFNVAVEKTVIFTRGNSVQILVQLADVVVAGIMKTALDGQNMYTGCHFVRTQFSHVASLDVKRPFDDRNWEGNCLQTSLVISPTLRVHLRGLACGKDEELADGVAALLAVYGNVVRVDIGRGEKGGGVGVFVQLQDLMQCRTAEQYLQNCSAVQAEMWSEVCEEECRFSKEYAATQPQLYARHRVDKVQKLYSPSMSLHLSNMPDDTSETELRAHLECADIRSLRFLDPQHHIAILVCGSVENALQTLMRVHGQTIQSVHGNARPVRVGFGHQPLDPVFYLHLQP